MTEQQILSTSILDRPAVVKDGAEKKIKVTIRIPDHLHGRIRQQKINQIYDILSPETSR